MHWDSFAFTFYFHEDGEKVTREFRRAVTSFREIRNTNNVSQVYKN
jgi:hypothetical protein